jgi:hypothetical protein
MKQKQKRKIINLNAKQLKKWKKNLVENEVCNTGPKCINLDYLTSFQVCNNLSGFTTEDNFVSLSTFKKAIFCLLVTHFGI